ncbi:MULTISPECIES: nuclear transport factor 2 family protein [unclassified Streptomyces]|uniref:nuclear transport factor 2 family protein n=1 Tax=unclassified Streptomyces TaxID=2593676 RepID=UPI002E0FDFB8|nr:nuclear transport factor 2 family protein [Streptomyces sp. NBC_01197]WSS50283.1 nuclear transport factor 2 family protein [Streptomyces sp. NBC_01180]
MTTTDTAGVIREHLRAFNARDLDALLAGFTEDALWVTGTTTVRGRAALAEFFRDAMEGLLPTLTVQNLVTEGSEAACRMTETLTFQGDEQTFSIAAFYLLHDRRIASAKIYREGSPELG